MGDSYYDRDSAAGGAAILILALVVGAVILVLFAAPVVLVGTTAGTVSLGLLPEQAQRKIRCTTQKERMNKSFVATAIVVGAILILHLVYFFSGDDPSSRFDHSIVGLYVRTVKPYYLVAGDWALRGLTTVKDVIVWLCESLYKLVGGTQG
jgi:hypothetical protein